MIIKFPKTIYPCEALIKAAYSFTDNYHMYVDEEENNYIVEIELMNGNSPEFPVSSFKDHVIMHTARFKIAEKTKNIREMIIGRALATTLIDNGEIENECEDFYEADTILKNWFESSDNYADN